MKPVIVRALAARRSSIEARWEAFMRLEPVTSPLGHPDTLVFGIRTAVDEILDRFLNPVSEEPGDGPVECRCGCNPLHAFFVAGEQAMLEALILLQAESQSMPAAERASSVAELRRAVRQIAHRDTAAIAALCQNAGRGRAEARS